MLPKQLLSQIFDDEALTRGLSDPEARVLVEWLVEQVEHRVHNWGSEGEAQGEVRKLCRIGRSVSRFVALWCHHNAPGAATQLAGAENREWPLPDGPVDPCELIQTVLDWEQGQMLEESLALANGSAPY